MSGNHFDKPTEIASSMVQPGMNIGILESLTSPVRGETERKIAGRVAKREGIHVTFHDGTDAYLFPQLGTAYVSIWGLPDYVEEHELVEFFEETLQEQEPDPEPEPEPEPVVIEVEEELYPMGAVALVDVPQWEVEGAFAQWIGDGWTLMGSSDIFPDNEIIVRQFAVLLQEDQAAVTFEEGDDEFSIRDAADLLGEQGFRDAERLLREIIHQF